MSKSEFVRSLQHELFALSPYDVSQRLRVAHGCVSVYRGDPDLKIEHFRGYMVRLKPDRKGTAENPELYQCVISLLQPKAWQDLVWTKEIIHILDRPEHRTKNGESLGHMLDNREISLKKREGTPANVIADKDGLILALGCAVPLRYREILRKENYLAKYELADLEKVLLIPSELVGQLLDKSFEADFEAALLHCDKE